MNQEQLNVWKSAAQKSDGLVRIYSEDLLAIIALAERALLAAAPAPIQQATRGMEDPIMIPRGLVGAACHVIRKNMPHSMLLEKLRAYTVGGYGEIAQSPPALAGSQVQAAGDEVNEREAFEAWQREKQGWLYTAEAEEGTFQEERWIAWQARAAMREQP